MNNADDEERLFSSAPKLSLAIVFLVFVHLQREIFFEVVFCDDTRNKKQSRKEIFFFKTQLEEEKTVATTLPQMPF